MNINKTNLWVVGEYADWTTWGSLLERKSSFPDNRLTIRGNKVNVNL